MAAGNEIAGGDGQGVEGVRAGGYVGLDMLHGHDTLAMGCKNRKKNSLPLGFEQGNGG